MESLFDDNECYTEDANELDIKVSRLLKPIVKEYLKYGYSSREVENILVNSVTMTCIEARLGKQVKRAKERRANAKKNL